MRADVVQSLLEQCASVKGKRLFLHLAEKHHHAWFKSLDLAGVTLGSGKRMLFAGGRLEAISNSIIRLASIFRCIRLELSRVNFCAAVMRLLRSDSNPVSRGGRPNISRKELVMLPSGSAMERRLSGMKV